MNDSPHHPVIVGVAPGQPPHVLEQAAYFASHFGTELVCVFVDQARLPVSEGDDGAVASVSIDPDSSDEAEEPFDAKLAAGLESVLRDTGVRWRTLVVAGEVSAALSRLAERLDAAMIVVGTHDRSVGGSIQEFFNRSVATHLAHRQPRPVVVIPAHAPGLEAPLLPWHEA
ncbi:universal stress protein [Arthrobacter sp. LAPM80]|uniref:universal stress protein n=1 Tax=Arthrobacter sp. LAPM80 TaxID=3141788 RepID=UPI00398A7E9B